MAAVVYWILQRSIIATEGKDAVLAQAIGKDRKGNVSVLVYAVAIPIAFLSHWVSQACDVAIALLWLVPDKRIERAPSNHDG
jgi:uncharacterized membrane protein